LAVLRIGPFAKVQFRPQPGIPTLYLFVRTTVQEIRDEEKTPPNSASPTPAPKSPEAKPTPLGVTIPLPPKVDEDVDDFKKPVGAEKQG
jgi:hypothetical protein